MEAKSALGPFGQPDSLRVLPLKKDGSDWCVLDKQDWDWAKRYYWGMRGRYVGRTVKREGKPTTALLHKRIAERMFSEAERMGKVVDHIDRNPRNNRRKNLRLATPAQNCQNRSSGKNNVSGVPGVFWVESKKTWVVRIRRKHLGSFSSLDEAIKVRKQAEATEYGEFAPKYTEAELLVQKRKQEEARDRAQSSIGEGTPVKLLNREGKEVILRKQRHLRDRKQQERVEEAAAELERNQVSLTYRNLVAMGFGMRALRDFFKKRKREVPDE